MPTFAIGLVFFFVVGYSYVSYCQYQPSDWLRRLFVSGVKRSAGKIVSVTS